jgi:hypothetical protein
MHVRAGAYSRPAYFCDSRNGIKRLLQAFGPRPARVPDVLQLVYLKHGD